MKYVAILIAISLIIGCEEESTTLRFTGTVYDTTNAPFEGARVELWAGGGFYRAKFRKEVWTDDLGKYLLVYIEPGFCPESLLWLKASKDGYYADRASNILCVEMTQVFDFHLETK